MSDSTTPSLVSRGRSFWAWVQRSRPWRTFSHFTDVGGNVLTAGMSYQAVFAVFAALWLGFSIFGIVLFSRPELLETLIHQLNVFVPGLIGEKGDGSLVSTEALRDASNAFSWTSAIAAAAVLWVVLNWFTGTRRAIRIIFGLEVKQYRNALLLKLRDLMLAIMFAIAILLSAALTVLTTNLTDTVFGWLDWNPESWLLGTMGTLTRYAAMYVFDVIVLMAVHRYLAEIEVSRFRLLWGCMIGGAGLLGLKILGALLLGGATSNPLLVSFAVLIGLLIWFNFVCRVLLLTAAWIATGVDRSLGLPIGPG